MVCAKCQRLSKSTTKLATPEVKKKSELYHGNSTAAGISKKGSTLGATGVSKSKLLSKSAKNPEWPEVLPKMRIYEAIMRHMRQDSRGW
ncbi:hypothetical protein B9Z65_3098 [Elsinoe australis]|uniref:Uncharacterized protein n=1 Tax=Elsinoe australis TaxID=40998 RepID=A0A2P7ZUE9_9PEZI|nr:hypothetical protein B9Z65_3098 [Elsinoe australis]